ncbi:MAG: hypothetical protein AAF352_03840, partial [Pseudomonadota bacterium]
MNIPLNASVNLSFPGGFNDLLQLSVLNAGQLCWDLPFSSWLMNLAHDSIALVLFLSKESSMCLWVAEMMVSSFSTSLHRSSVTNVSFPSPVATEVNTIDSHLLRTSGGHCKKVFGWHSLKERVHGLSVLSPVFFLF